MAPGDAVDPSSIAAVMPARTELVATWRPTAGEELPEGSLHPAVVGLFDAIDERDLDLVGTEVRQTVLGSTEDDAVIEVAVTVSRLPV